LFEDFPLSAEPVLLVLIGFTTTAFIQLVGPLSYLDGTASAIIANLPGELFEGTTTGAFGCLLAMGSNMGILQCTKGGVLQMD
jgi:hypothetical protein